MRIVVSARLINAEIFDKDFASVQKIGMSILLIGVSEDAMQE
jgi:hypothetical protein